jgi:hypothetical protein
MNMAPVLPDTSRSLFEGRTAPVARPAALLPGAGADYAKRDQTAASCLTESLNPVCHIKLMVNIGEVEINRTFAYLKLIRDFFARIALDH